jgi:glycerophosphoryl diester phosphodiesterase
VTNTVLIAHRGLDDTYPENTLPAFEAALNLGMGIEFDLAMTSDQQLVVLHDDTVDRTTNGVGRIAQMSLGAVRELDAGIWKGQQFSAAKVPTFDEALALVADRAKANLAIALDVKDLQPGIINLICDALAVRGVMDKTVGIGIITQSVDVRRRFYEGNAQFPCAAVAQTPESLESAVKDPYSTWIYGRFVPSPADVEKVHVAGKKLFVSGEEVSNEVAAAQKAAESGPDAVLTWHPTELHSRLSG